MLERLCLALLAVVLGGCAAASVPSVSLVATPSPDVIPTPTPSAIATVAPTERPTPDASPTPSPDPAVLALEAIGCNGGVVLEWSASTHPDFHHYIALRSPDGEIAPDYPPIAPAVDWGDTYATDRFVTSAVDASIIPSDSIWHYRVMAYDADGRVVSASSVQPAQMGEVADLGSVTVVTAVGGRTGLGWEAYTGLPQCFSSYRVLSGVGGTASTLLTSISAQTTTELQTDALHAGIPYALRVQAVRATTLGSFVVGETDTLAFTVP
ncbi:MAG: hypothetical protein ACR2I5_07335 [Candidatus Limnocylindria bacterium]